jgi:acetyltransferase-like isoleucine patch superfamily enzyme
MTDLHEEFEIAKRTWGDAAAEAILRVYEQEKFGSTPCVALNFIDRTVTIGTGSKVWHFAVVLGGVTIGADCVIGSRCEIGFRCAIGDGTHIGSGTFLPSDSIIGQRVFIGPNVTCCDDRHPKIPDPGDPPYHAQPPVIEDGASIGAGAVLLPGIHIGKLARIGAGAIVTRDVPDNAHVRGEPARLHELSVAAVEAWQ